MSSFNPAFGGFGCDHGRKLNISPGDVFESRPAFRQSENRSYPYGYAPDGDGGGISSPFKYDYPFGFTPAALAHSYRPFGFTPCNGGNSVPAFGHNSHPFGFTPSNGGNSAPAFGHNSHPFGFTPGNGGSSVPAFGHNSHPFGFTSGNGGNSAPTIGHNSHPFELPPTNGGTSATTFGQNSSPFESTPANGGTSVPTFGKSSNSFGFTSSNGGSSVPPFGQSSTTPFAGAPANNETSVPTFGQSSTPFGYAPANSGTSVPVFGRRTDSFGFTPSNTTTSVPSWQRSSSLGSVSPNGETPETTLGEGKTYLVSTPTPTNGGFTSFSQTPVVNALSSPGFGFGCTTTCRQPILPAGSSLFGTGSHLCGTQNHLSGSTTHFQTPAMNASSPPGFGFGCLASGQATTQFGTSSNLFGTSTHSGRIQVPFSGNQVKTPLPGVSSSESFTFSVNRGGTRATPYTETVLLEDNSQLSRIMSMSAMPGFKDKCHEELRWEDKQLGDNGNIPLFHSVRSGKSAIKIQPKGSNVMPYTKTMIGEDGSRATSISAMPVYQDKSHEELRWKDHQFNNAGDGVDPASEQLNCFRNPISGTDSSFLNAMNSSVGPNLFASSPPCFTFSTFSNPFTSNSSLNDSRAGPYTSITQPPSIFSPTITFSHPNPTIMSASASEASTSSPSLFDYTSSAPCASICSTSVTIPVTASVPCNFTPSISTRYAVSPSRCTVETPPAVPQISAEGPKTASVRFGISSKPVEHLADEKQQLLTPQWNRKDDGPKVLVSADAQETSTTARKKIPLLPKHNSGVLISGPSEEWNLRIDFENLSLIKHTSIHVYESGKVSVELSKPLADGSVQDGSVQDKIGISGETLAAEHSHKPKSIDANYPSQKEVALDVYWLLPKLKDSEYFIQPRVEELAIKESFDPGFCSHVKDFVVGHHRYGRIKFLGETDVRKLDVNSHIVFGNREVILSMDENKKPPVGQGLNKLNKAAEVTLCNIKCVDKAGNQHISGPKVDKYRKKLMKKAVEQGAEFVSYDPVQGEWKFRVEHF